jgi:hypothetical protein
MWGKDTGDPDGLTELLFCSAELLRERPALFAPKLVTTFLGAVWFIAFLEEAASPLLFVASVPLLTAMSLFASVLLAGAVREGSLAAGAREIVQPRKFAELIATSIALFVAILLISLPLSTGIFVYRTSGSLVWLGAGAALTVGMMLGLSFLGYFLPVTLLERGPLSAAMSSARHSSQNRRDVAALTLLSLLLLGVAFSLQEELRFLGYAGFVAGRLLSSAANTYAFVVAPTYYDSTKG